MLTINRKKKKEKKSVPSSEYGTKLKVCNHPVLSPIKMELIVDTSRGENIFDSALLVYLELWKIPKDQKPQTNNMSNAVKIWAAGVPFGPKGTVRKSSLD